MFAARKHTALAAVSIASIVILSAAGGALGGRAHWGQHDRLAPTSAVNLRVTAATTSTVSIAWDAASDNVAVAGYLVYAAGRRAVVQGTTYVVTRLSCGESYPLSVIAFDSQNNRSGALNGTVTTQACPDLRAPSAPAGFRQSATTQSAVILSWRPSADDVGVTHYDVYQHLVPIGSPTQPTITLTGLSCGKVYEYTVDAVDAAGNHSYQRSVWVNTASCVDSAPPTIPSALSVASRTQTSIALDWSPSTDNVGVTGYQVSVNGAATKTVTTPNANITKLKCGVSYRVSVDAFDAAGNQSKDVTTDVATSSCPSSPSPSPSPPTDTTPPSKPGALSVVAATTTSLKLAWSDASDNTAVVGYDIYVDGTLSSTGAHSPSTLTALTCGRTYSLAVDAYDAAGNRSEKATLDAPTSPCATPSPPSPPPPGDTTAPSQPGNLAVSSTTASSVSLSWSASADDVAVAGYTVYVDGTQAGGTGGTGYSVNGLTCGTAHTFAVDAYDGAGNRSSKSQVIASTSACPDTQAPTAPSNVTIMSRTSTSVALSWAAAADNVGVTGYTLYRAGTRMATTTDPSGIFSGLSCDTSYTLSIDAYDGAGNHSAKANVGVTTTACADTSPPSRPTNLSTSQVTQTGLTLAWTASTDDTGVAGYDLYRNGAKVGSGTGTSSTQTDLACGTSYALAVDAYDAAGNTSPQATTNASTAACPTTPAPPSPPPPSPPPSNPSQGCAVDLATMTAPGCTLLRDDTAANSDPSAGLWGKVDAVDSSRYSYSTTGGDSAPMANGASQGNSAYREMTVKTGDEKLWDNNARAELGRNDSRSGENSGSQTSGTFALFHEGEHKIIFWSMRFPSNFDFQQSNWQVIMQGKQAEPYVGNGPTDGAPAFTVQAYGGKLHLDNFWNDRWTTSAPPHNVWIRFALDVVFSKDPAKGRIQAFVDLNGDGDFLDSGESSGVINAETLAYASSAGDGYNTGDPIPGHLRLGVYHNPAIPGCSVDIDNVQVVGG